MPIHPDMTEKISQQGIVEQIIAGCVFKNMPDMSGDNRVRLTDQQYRGVQAAAREVIAFLKEQENINAG